MSEELCFNLWYYLRADQTIYVLAARAYMLSGTDYQKEETLKSLSGSDWKVAISWPPSTAVLEQFGGNVPYWVLGDLGIEPLYADLFEQLYNDFPQHLSLPDEKMYFATPLFDFGGGYVPAEIGDGFIRKR